MKLTPDQTEIVVKKLENLLGSACERCKTQEWLVNDRIFELKEFGSSPISSAENNAVYPVVVVACKNCGTTHFFSAILLGLLEKK